MENNLVLGHASGITSTTMGINSATYVGDYPPIVKKEIKHYLGDIKWVLYQYICDLGGDKFSFRCGNYAYNKISSMSGFTESKLCTVSGSLNLNGEYIYVTNIEDFDKKMVVISHKVFNDGEIHKEINNDDIVLYFA